MAEPSATAAVSIARLTHRFPGATRPTLEIDALEIATGGRLALIGASGAGKTTLLRLVDGRLRGWTGAASVLGHPLDARRPPPRERRCETGFIFQEFALVEPASVYQNVLNGRLGRTHAGWSLAGRFKPEDEEAVERAMGDVGISELARRRADRLSGGQRQRVAIARVLAQEPRLLLADEPISNLDPVNAAAILDLLRALAEKRGATLIVSSHQPRIVAPYVDRFVALERGRIVLDGTPEAIHDERLAAVYAAERAEESEVVE